MRRLLILAASFTALTNLAVAQPTRSQAPLFMSPMGQPFRASATETGEQKWFAQADADHDGKISLAEFVADADAALAHADANGDGSVTSAESTALWRAEAPEVLDENVSYAPPLDPNAVQDASRSGHHTSSSSSSNTGANGALVTPRVTRRQGGPRPVGAQAFGLLGDAEPIMSCDTNFDRRIEKTEFEQCAARRFVELDANRDGFFTPDEVHPWLTAQEHAER
ncbi:MAG: EF-hand domain-containing protein [Terricaulis sp.]